jgi:6Fe-6S prismane cluster-containing protein
LSGVCGKTPEVANMQDLLLFVVRGVAVYNQELRKAGTPSSEADKFVFDGLFMTITNANFDKQAIINKIKEGLALKKRVG